MPGEKYSESLTDDSEESSASETESESGSESEEQTSSASEYESSVSVSSSDSEQDLTSEVNKEFSDSNTTETVVIESNDGGETKTIITRTVVSETPDVDGMMSKTSTRTVKSSSFSLQNESAKDFQSLDKEMLEKLMSQTGGEINEEMISEMLRKGGGQFTIESSGGSDGATSFIISSSNSASNVDGVALKESNEVLNGGSVEIESEDGMGKESNNGANFLITSEITTEELENQSSGDLNLKSNISEGSSHKINPDMSEILEIDGQTNNIEINSAIESQDIKTSFKQNESKKALGKNTVKFEKRVVRIVSQDSDYSESGTEYTASDVDIESSSESIISIETEKIEINSRQNTFESDETSETNEEINETKREMDHQTLVEVSNKRNGALVVEENIEAQQVESKRIPKPTETSNDYSEEIFEDAIPSDVIIENEKNAQHLRKESEDDLEEIEEQVIVATNKVNESESAPINIHQEKIVENEDLSPLSTDHENRNEEKITKEIITLSSDMSSEIVASATEEVIISKNPINLEDRDKLIIEPENQCTILSQPNESDNLQTDDVKESKDRKKKKKEKKKKSSENKTEKDVIEIEQQTEKATETLLKNDTRDIEKSETIKDNGIKTVDEELTECQPLESKHETQTVQNESTEEDKTINEISEGIENKSNEIHSVGEITKSAGEKDENIVTITEPVIFEEDLSKSKVEPVAEEKDDVVDFNSSSGEATPVENHENKKVDPVEVKLLIEESLPDSVTLNCQENDTQNNLKSQAVKNNYDSNKPDDALTFNKFKSVEDLEPKSKANDKVFNQGNDHSFERHSRKADRKSPNNYEPLNKTTKGEYIRPSDTRSYKNLQGSSLDESPSRKTILVRGLVNSQEHLSGMLDKCKRSFGDMERDIRDIKERSLCTEEMYDRYRLRKRYYDDTDILEAPRKKYNFENADFVIENLLRVAADRESRRKREDLSRANHKPMTVEEMTPISYGPTTVARQVMAGAYNNDDRYSPMYSSTDFGKDDSKRQRGQRSRYQSQFANAIVTDFMDDLCTRPASRTNSRSTNDVSMMRHSGGGTDPRSTAYGTAAQVTAALRRCGLDYHPYTGHVPERNGVRRASTRGQSSPPLHRLSSADQPASRRRYRSPSPVKSRDGRQSLLIITSQPQYERQSEHLMGRRRGRGRSLAGMKYVSTGDLSTSSSDYTGGNGLKFKKGSDTIGSFVPIQEGSSRLARQLAEMGAVSMESSDEGKSSARLPRFVPRDLKQCQLGALMPQSERDTRASRSRARIIWHNKANY